jgi:hypothetical protein
MYNESQSGQYSNLNKDIFQVREYMIRNILLKNNIELIKHRSKNNKNSLLKEQKIIYINKQSSPKHTIQRPIKTFLPIKTSPKYTTNNTNNTNNNNNNYNYNYNYIQTQTIPSVLMRPTSINASFGNGNGNINGNSFISTNIKATVDSGEKSYKSHKCYKNQFIDAKKRNSFNNGLKIDKQNEKFGNKLKRINSPLSRDTLNNSYSRLKEYRSIAKKIDPYKKEDINNQKRIDYIRKYLPPLLLKTPNFNLNSNYNLNISKSNHMLGIGKINNFRKFDS